MSDLVWGIGQGRPVIFGEVLFDTFPDGSAVLGGAPFNVAWHLQGFGEHPLFISRVGRDPNGDQVLSRMAEWGMDTRGVQHDAEHPTGVVQVRLRDGQPSFEIVPEQAYDFIDAQQAATVLAGEPCALLYSGTLITRGAVSRRTLQRLREVLEPAEFVDLNLRTPWWDAERVQEALAGARWLKLNDHELATVLGRPMPALAALTAGARELCARHSLQLVIVTRGADGALFVTPHTAIDTPPAAVAELVDTVGAGDAFSAVTLLGLLHDWAPQTTLQRAARFAAAVCGLRGATTLDENFYTAQLAEWTR